MNQEYPGKLPGREGAGFRQGLEGPELRTR